MLQQEQPEDFVIATGVQYSVRDFVRMAAKALGIELEFKGQGIDEQAIVTKITGNRAPKLKPGDVIVKVDPRYFRPAEVETLLGDPSYAQKRLGWKPEISIETLIDEMIDYDHDQACRHALLRDSGYAVNLASEN